MAIRVYKVADIVENEVIPSRQQKFKAGDIAAMLVGQEAIADNSRIFLDAPACYRGRPRRAPGYSSSATADWEIYPGSYSIVVR
jgi:hypothetical protein